MVKATQRVLPFCESDEKIDLPANVLEELVESVAVLLLQILDTEHQEREETDDEQ